MTRAQSKRSGGGGGSGPAAEGAAEQAVASLVRLVRSGHGLVTMRTAEEEFALEVVRAAASDLSKPLTAWSAVRGVHDGLLEDGDEVRDTENAAAALLLLRHRAASHLVVTLDLGDHMEDARARRGLRDLVARCEEEGGCVVMVDHDAGPRGALETLATGLELPLPDEEELLEITRRTLTDLHRRDPIDVKVSRTQKHQLMRGLRGLTRRQAALVVREAAAEDRVFDINDLDGIIQHKRRLLSGTGVLEFVESPATLEGVGGLRMLKRWLAARERSFEPEAASYGLTPPRGVLMLGVQGTGKSLTAKAIATAWRRPLLRLDPGSLYDRYIGESERRLREALEQAEAMSPAVLWIDEIEKGFAAAASQSTDGGLSKRMFGRLLTWMQEHESPVFLVATANDIDALPPELLRKGRFDEIFFVDLPRADVRAVILGIHLSKRGRDPEQLGIDLERLAAAAEGFSASELEQAVLGALHDAFHAGEDVTTERLERVIRESPPLSVTAAEKVRRLQEWARDRCVPAD